MKSSTENTKDNNDTNNNKQVTIITVNDNDDSNSNQLNEEEELATGIYISTFLSLISIIIIDMESFTFSHATLYLTLLGDCYYKLIMSTRNNNDIITIPNNNQSENIINKAASFLNDEKCIEEFSFRCMYAYEKGLQYADENLDITDSIRLFCIVSYCRGLRDIQYAASKARKYAKKIFLKACGHNFQIDKSSVELLQKLRDMFLIDNNEENNNLFYTTGILPEYSVASSGFAYDENINDEEESEDEGDDDDTLESDDAEEEGYNQDGAVSSGRSPRKAKKNKEKKKKRKGSKHLDPFSMIELEKASKHFAYKLRRNAFLPTPINIEALPYGPGMLEALQRIFRAYVRGNSLAGQLVGNSRVELDGISLPVGAFILNGPYLSWKGFISIILDFNISSIPEPKSSESKGFPDIKSSEEETGVFRSRPPAPLNIEKTASLFIEACKSHHPSLTTPNFIADYEEMAKSYLADIDSWSLVAKWKLLEENKWDITAGLNFMQFLDLIGKCGLIAYSTKRFQSHLPRAEDKIRHFLSAHLGLQDKRKWLKIVQLKESLISKAIQAIADKVTVNSKEPMKIKGDN